MQCLQRTLQKRLLDRGIDGVWIKYKNSKNHWLKKRFKVHYVAISPLTILLRSRTKDFPLTDKTAGLFFQKVAISRAGRTLDQSISITSLATAAAIKAKSTTKSFIFYRSENKLWLLEVRNCRFIYRRNFLIKKLINFLSYQESSSDVLKMELENSSFTTCWWI